MGHSRYYNEANLLMTVSDTDVTVTSGEFDNFGTAVPPAEFNNFVTLTNSFYDWRESKTIRPVDLDIGALKTWSATNLNVRAALGNRDINSVYVYHDRRTVVAGKLGAVRVRNGLLLPPLGLTVASASPIYVLGQYNQTKAANLGTANTSTTLPASLVGDAVTILSVNWSDANSGSHWPREQPFPPRSTPRFWPARSRPPTEITAAGWKTFHDSWNPGGSPIHSPITDQWSKCSRVYTPPIFGASAIVESAEAGLGHDPNFNTPTKLPPLTPSLLKIFRNVWTTLAPNSTTPPPSS